MDPHHLHMVLNHIPAVGLLFGLILLAIGLIANKAFFQGTGLVTLVTVSLALGATYWTGEGKSATPRSAVPMPAAARTTNTTNVNSEPPDTFMPMGVNT